MEGREAKTGIRDNSLECGLNHMGNDATDRDGPGGEKAVLGGNQSVLLAM